MPIYGIVVLHRCGSGLSGEALSDDGHYWVGIDISPSMLSELFYFTIHFIPLLLIGVAQERDCDGDLILSDMGEGLGFKPGSFDGAIRYNQFANNHDSIIIIIIVL